MGGEVDVAAVVGDKNVFVSATRFHGQLTGEVRSRGIVAGNGTDERGAVYKGVPKGRGGRTKRGDCEGGLIGRVGFWRSVGFFELRLGDQGR